MTAPVTNAVRTTSVESSTISPIGNFSGREVKTSYENTTSEKTATTAEDSFSYVYITPTTSSPRSFNESVSLMQSIDLFADNGNNSTWHNMRSLLSKLLIEYPMLLMSPNTPSLIHTEEETTIIHTSEDLLNPSNDIFDQSTNNLNCAARNKLLEYAQPGKDFISQIDLNRMLDDIEKCDNEQNSEKHQISILRQELTSIMDLFSDHLEDIDDASVQCIKKNTIEELCRDPEAFFQKFEMQEIPIEGESDESSSWTTIGVNKASNMNRYIFPGKSDSPTVNGQSPTVDTPSKELEDVILHQDEIIDIKKLGVELKVNEPNGWTLRIGGTTGTTISMERAFIDKMEVDFFVNAANSNLLEGSGVCGAIFKGAGSEELTKACDSFKPLESGRPSFPGDTKMTPAYELNGSVIIHAVGPCMVAHSEPLQNLGQATYLLDKVYNNILRSADLYIEKLKSGEKPDETLWPAECENSKDAVLLQKITDSPSISVAIPLISTGVFGFPQVNATKISLSSLIRYVVQNKTKISDIKLVVFPAHPDAEEIEKQHKNFITETFELKV